MLARRRALPYWLALMLATAALGAEKEPANAPAEEQEDAPSLDQLYETGKALFDQFAPAEVKEQFEFPGREQWDEFAGRLQQALEGDDLETLVQYLPDARAALGALQALPGYEDYAQWLQELADPASRVASVLAKGRELCDELAAGVAG